MDVITHARNLRTRKGRYFDPPWAMAPPVVPAVYPPQSLQTRIVKRGVLARRGRYCDPPWIPPPPPPPAVIQSQQLRSRTKTYMLRRGRYCEPPWPQIATPVAPTYHGVNTRIRVNPALLRRGRWWNPYWPQAAPPAPLTQALLIREKAPLGLHVTVATPAGFHQRWGADDPNPGNAPSALTFSTAMPGGFQDAQITLQRDPRRSYPDLELLSTLTVLGAGGEVAWQGRVEQLPDTGGDQSQISPQCVGWQSHLDDDDSAREIFVDRDITAWQGPAVQRQIDWLNDFGLGGGAVVATGPSVAPDFSNGYPSLACTLQGAWSQNQVVEGWYDAHGIPIGELYAAWETNGAFTLTGGTAFGAATFLLTDDAGDAAYDSYNPITVTPGQHALAASAADRLWGLLQLWNDTIPGGQDGVSYSLFWTALGVYGYNWLAWLLANGGSLHGTADQTDAQGILASDAVAYTISKWCPKLTFTRGQTGTIQPSVFVLPQLAFLEPTTASAIVKQAVSYELLDWAVWEEPIGVWPAQPCFYLNARGSRASYWRTRVGPAQLQETGMQISALWNGVIVQWSDVSGVTRTVGPPGSGCNYTSTALVTTDPSNPANQAGIRRWALVTMGTSTLSGATQVGQVFLQQQALLNHSGQATLQGYVQDTHGISWPAWMVRGGDYVTFTDAADTSPRRVVSTSWDDAAKANTVQLDQPPDALDALLARLSVALKPIGLS